MSASPANEKWAAISSGLLVLGSFWLLAQCGGGSSTTSGTSKPDGSTIGEGGSEASTPEASTEEPDGNGPGPDGSIADAAPEAAPPQPCGAQEACTAPGATCCSGICVNTATDPSNCGSCGNACTAGQFCNGTACNSAILANLCANPKGTVVTDNLATDDQAGTSLGDGLTTSCPTPPTIVSLAQTTAGVLAPTFRPTTGPGNTFITGGGAYGQDGVRYMEANYTPIYLNTTNNDIVQRSTAENLVTATTASQAAMGAGQDYFYIQVTVEPVGGTLCFEGAGVFYTGTEAAAYYFQNVMAPNLSTYTDSWYVYEWTDTNSDGNPDSGDTFTLVASGM